MIRRDRRPSPRARSIAHTSRLPVAAETCRWRTTALRCHRRQASPVGRRRDRTSPRRCSQETGRRCAQHQPRRATSQQGTGIRCTARQDQRRQRSANSFRSDRRATGGSSSLARAWEHRRTRAAQALPTLQQPRGWPWPTRAVRRACCSSSLKSTARPSCSRKACPCREMAAIDPCPPAAFPRLPTAGHDRRRAAAAAPRRRAHSRSWPARWSPGEETCRVAYLEEATPATHGKPEAPRHSECRLMIASASSASAWKPSTGSRPIQPR